MLFLNPDTEIVDGTFGELVALLDERPRSGSPACASSPADGALWPTIRRFPSAARALGEALGSERWPVRPRWAGERVLDLDAYEREGECDWTSGSFMLARREALLSAGLLDERFFIYSEEPDLCLRIKRAGWEIRHLPEMTIVHHAGKGGVRPRMVAQDAFARRQYAHKHFAQPGRTAYLGRFLPATPCAPSRRGSRMIRGPAARPHAPRSARCWAEPSRPSAHRHRRRLAISAAASLGSVYSSRPVSRAEIAVWIRVSPASKRGSQPSSRRALLVSISTGVARAVAHSSCGETKERRPATAVPTPSAGPRHPDRAPAERAGDVGDLDLALAGEVVGAGLALARDRGGEGRATSSWWTSWSGTPASGRIGRSSGSRSSTCRRRRGAGSPSRAAPTICSISIVARGPATMQGRKT